MAQELQSPLVPGSKLLAYFAFMPTIIILMMLTAAVVVVAKGLYFKVSPRWRLVIRAVLVILIASDIFTMAYAYFSFLG